MEGSWDLRFTIFDCRFKIFNNRKGGGGGNALKYATPGVQNASLFLMLRKIRFRFISDKKRKIIEMGYFYKDNFFMFGVQPAIV